MRRTLVTVVCSTGALLVLVGGAAQAARETVSTSVSTSSSASTSTPVSHRSDGATAESQWDGG
ncbi:hypothetical protein ACIRNI_07305 [Streptomyces sp. NPDC093546]|uniref:hypothetical protein n=1 Tax=Streptomyces sp. NPDC093546 TaxID=3366040 RepID=UPI003808791F